MLPLFLALAPLAQADDPVATSEASDPVEIPGGPALSVGTGPRPLDDLTLGLTGLGARVLLPGPGRVVPWLGGQASSGAVVTYSKGDYAEREGGGLTVFAVSAGARIEAAARGEADLVPYVIVGGLAAYGWGQGGEPGERGRIGGPGLGALGGFGLDAFLTPHLSVGAELGGMGVAWAGRHVWDGDEQSRQQLLAGSTFTALQATVWR